MKVIQDDLWLCECCLFAAVNGDSCQCGDKHDREVTAGLDRLGIHLVPNFDSETNEGINEFSWRHCDCCLSHLGGSRHRFAILGEDDPSVTAAATLTRSALLDAAEEARKLDSDDPEVHS